MTIRESAEDYLESILMLKEEKHYARAVDIAARLNVTKPSVSVAMKHLREEGYITVDDDNLISLTEKGNAIASRIYDRHTTLTKYLVMLGVDEEIARQDACKMEHDLSEESFHAFKSAVLKNEGKEI
ncbi:MAG: metal-dependent transcriptional regulator [Clostridia bacterium]|nr:metal-dependent transcriptional regulator [Clostridia bacterium]MBR2287726.1 metal-dependent transcriptional regulator [Clostridia bacterium]